MDLKLGETLRKTPSKPSMTRDLTKGQARHNHDDKVKSKNGFKPSQNAKDSKATSK